MDVKVGAALLLCTIFVDKEAIFMYDNLNT